jgi:hypothetical protein
VSTQLKRTIYLIIISCIISFSLVLLSNESKLFIPFINNLFYISLALLVVGGVMLIIQGGILIGINYSFKRFYKRVFRIGRYIEEKEENLSYSMIDDNKDLYLPRYTYTFPIVASGLTLFVVTILFAFMY